MNNGTEQIFIINSNENQPTSTTQRLMEIPEPPQVNLENVQDFSNVCRTCATVTEFVIPIFEGEGLQNNLADKIRKHLPIRVSQQDVLPRVVCYQCASTLLAWHELVACCVQADAALRSRLPLVPTVPPAEQDRKPTVSTPSQTVSNISNLTNMTPHRCSTPIEFYSMVRNALRDYYHTLNVDENDSDMNYVCQKCSEKSSFTSLATLADHLHTKHLEEVSSQKKLAIFIKTYITFEETLISEASDREAQSDVEDKPDKKLPNYCCPFCENIYSSTTRLLCHINKHVDVTIEHGVICCDVIYNDKNAFVQHLQTSHVDRVISSHVCKTCGYSTDDVNDLQTHINDAHLPKEVAKEKKPQSTKIQKYIPAVCPECNKTFSNKYNMFVHLKSHKQTEVYQCDKCDKTYTNRGNLTSHHRLAHEGILKYVCSECGEAFPTRSGRDVHARIHSGVKPYKCEYCEKAYRAKNTLDRHIEIHFDIRKYECKICNKKFRKRTHLNYHLNTHTKKSNGSCLLQMEWVPDERDKN